VTAAVLPADVPAPEVTNAVVDGRTFDDFLAGEPPAPGFHDGDTVTVWVHRGGSDYSRWNVRVLGAACRELADPGGEETREELNTRLPAGTRVALLQVRDDKYGGRKLARVVYVGPDGQPVDLAVQLVADRWAMPWDGRGEQPRIPWPREVALC
jgi:endonuclease YncB( thermonuclease family)